MTTESAILENVKKLPESVKEAVLLYTKFLASQYTEKTAIKSADISKQCLAGSMRETFKLPLPKDFNKPLAVADTFLSENAEAKYGYGSLAGKITMSEDFDEPLEDLGEYM